MSFTLCTKRKGWARQMHFFRQVLGKRSTLLKLFIQKLNEKQYSRNGNSSISNSSDMKSFLSPKSLIGAFLMSDD